MGESRNQKGRFTPEHTDGDILAAVRAHEPAGTSEIADEVGMSRQGADRRLRRLRDGGRVNSKKIAASRIWFTEALPEPTDRPAPDEWAEKRRETLARDGYTCRECGADVSKTGSEIHHITPLAAGGDNSLSNLKTLCPNCHGEKHRGETLDNVLDVFNQVRGPAVISADVADALGCTRETARRKLQQLYDRGDLARRKVSRRVIYWRVENAARDADTADATQTPRENGTAETRPRRPENDPVASVVEDLPGEGVDHNRRRDAVRKMYDHLRTREGERLSKSDFATLLDGEDLGYAGGFASLWSNWVKASSDHPNTLAELSGVERRGDHYVFEGDT
jgi:predicted transcriptional regulator